MPPLTTPDDDTAFREEVRAGFAELNHGESVPDEEALRRLRAAIAEGDAGADAPPGVFDRIRAKYGLAGRR